MTHQVSKKIHFCYGHRLIHHPGKCARYHGHNGIAEIECASPALNTFNMVVDFDVITQNVKKWIDDVIDHRMILNEKDEMIPLLDKLGHQCFKVAGDPTAELLAKIIFEHSISKGLPVTRVTVWETPDSSATYVG